MTRKLALVVLAAALGGCAQLQNDWDILTNTAVSPTQIVVAANAYDAAEASATQYLIYCKANPAQAACALATRQKVVAGVRAGRQARNQLEPYITSGTAGPIALYNTLQAAITSLQTSTPTAGASK
jgi:hypothetical protein